MAAAPIMTVGPLAWMRANLFNSITNTIVTLVVLVVFAYAIPGILNWAVFDAVLTIKPSPDSILGFEFAPSSEACRIATGACWDFVIEKHRVMVFGLFPHDQLWRPLLMIVVLLGMVIVSLNTDLWGRTLTIAWVIALPGMFILMQGGLFGLTFVETSRWGGLPITLILSVNAIVLSFPLAILLALGRRSDLPIIKTLCVGFIEAIRGVPLITLLFMASLMLPLFLPEGTNINKLLRAQIGLILFSAAYVAEVIRGGLQAIPKGQTEAGEALGLNYWQNTFFILLPQALKLVIPPTVNTFIGLFKDTTLIIIISMYDFLGAIRLASADPEWRPFYVEGLVLAALVYFIFCFAMASYARRLEARLDTSQR